MQDRSCVAACFLTTPILGLAFPRTGKSAGCLLDDTVEVQRIIITLPNPQEVTSLSMAWTQPASCALKVIVEFDGIAPSALGGNVNSTTHRMVFPPQVRVLTPSSRPSGTFPASRCCLMFWRSLVCVFVCASIVAACCAALVVASVPCASPKAGHLYNRPGPTHAVQSGRQWPDRACQRRQVPAVVCRHVAVRGGQAGHAGQYAVSAAGGGRVGVVLPRPAACVHAVHVQRDRAQSECR